MSERYWLERAWLGEPSAPREQAIARDVLVTVEGGRFSNVEPGVPGTPTGTPAGTPAGALRLPGLTIPGMANGHSHAFHRALRGRTQRGRGTFWTWREQMYALAERLDPDSYYDLARATYREMLAAGFTSVGEFHYLHHARGGRPYDDPNAMGRALVDAALDTGIRIALLDTCYLAAGIGRPPEGVQLRFSDGDADAWASRVAGLEPLAGEAVTVGAAIHSVRAVPRDGIVRVAAWAEERQAPLHVHLSEQVAENDDCLAAHGVTPTALLADAGALGPRSTAVHATHLTDDDVAALGRTGTHVCFCPTTERDLGDGIGPSRRLTHAGAPLTLGSDSHAVVDPFEEMRAVELDERLASERRGHFADEELLVAATSTGHASLGFSDGGRIAVGARADLVTLDTRSPRTAGTGASVETAVFAATGADVTHVVAGGRLVATRDDHEEIGRELDAVITKLWQEDA